MAASGVVEASKTTGRYQAYTLRNIDQIPEFGRLSREHREALIRVGHVLPFKTNNYVVEQLINWDDVPNDPMFVLTFPQPGMLKPGHDRAMALALEAGDHAPIVAETADRIRYELNPHPAGQLEHNVPEILGEPLQGVQHKYQETVLLFPSNGQTCHAYCTFCFRWPQFVGDADLKFATREADQLVEYLRQHPEVSDVLITGGDPLVMKTAHLERYIGALLEADLPSLRTIRIGTKSLSYWPYRFTSDADAEELLGLFRRVTERGLHLAIMAHVNHPRELSTDAVKEAIGRILETGAKIRTQSPLMRGINDDPAAWNEMWRAQVQLGLIPYYMFVARDTGAQHYFSVPLVRAWQVFREAYANVSGLARTVRGPSMSTDPGKVRVVGVADVRGEKVLTLEFLQARNPEWVGQPFFARYDASATWLDELRPAFGETEFFFEQEMRRRFGGEEQELVVPTFEWPVARGS